MTHRRRGGRTIALISAVGLLLTGCSSFATSKSIDPCEVLTASELSSFGDYGDPSKVRRNKQRSECTWYEQVVEPFENTLRPQLNITVRHKSRFTPAKPEEGERAGRTASGRQFKEWNSDVSCSVRLPVYEKQSKRKRATITIAVAKPNPRDNCGVARKMADLVAPRLL